MATTRQRARVLRNNLTDAEGGLWRVLRGRQLDGFRCRRQVPIAGFIADFACPQARLIVEVDGGEHGDAVAADAARTARFGQLGYRVLRFWNREVLLHAAEVADAIWRELTRGVTPPQPSPSPAARGREQERQQKQKQQQQQKQQGQQRHGQQQGQECSGSERIECS